jgi:hypothetical protein
MNDSFHRRGRRVRRGLRGWFVANGAFGARQASMMMVTTESGAAVVAASGVFAARHTAMLLFTTEREAGIAANCMSTPDTQRPTDPSSASSAVNAVVSKSVNADA